jgi:hypothetical protein
MADWDMMNQAPAAAGDAAPANKRLDRLVWYMIFHWVLGALAGALFATALLVFDPFGLRPLMHDSGLGAEAAFLLYVGFMTTFGGLVCAAAVMFPPNDDDGPRGGLRGNVTSANLRPRLAARQRGARAAARSADFMVEIDA